MNYYLIRKKICLFIKKILIYKENIYKVKKKKKILQDGNEDGLGVFTNVKGTYEGNLGGAMASGCSIPR